MEEHGFAIEKEDRLAPKDFPLAWHKFLIFFVLWFRGIGFLFQGIQHMTGSIYQDDKDSIYSVFDGLQTIEIIFGISLILLGVYTIYTRYQLAGFKMGAPSKLYIMHGAEAACGVIYWIAFASATHLPLNTVSDNGILGLPVASIIWILINRTYYNKRIWLFIN